MAKPDEALASRIVDRMRKASALSEPALSKVLIGLSAGTLSVEDWKLLVELEASAKKGAAVEDK